MERRLVATGQYGVDGLFWGGDGAKQLWAQIWGNAVIALAAFGISFVILQADQRGRDAAHLEEGEREGIDRYEHGSPAYHPEAAYMGQGPS